MPPPKKSFAPPRDSLVWRVCDYLTANPEEELLRGDIATKFDADPATIDDELAAAVSTGFLVRVSVQDSGIVWRLGKRNAAPTPQPFTATMRGAKRALRPAPVDIGTFKIESGVPLGQSFSRLSQWSELFDRMQPGDSFQLPEHARATVAHAHQRFRKFNASAAFAMRRVSDTHWRLWRTA